jgi:hypothetical protein
MTKEDKAVVLFRLFCKTLTNADLVRSDDMALWICLAAFAKVMGPELANEVPECRRMDNQVKHLLRQIDEDTSIEPLIRRGD